jgi:diacylglycerol O-acyltransferase
MKQLGILDSAFINLEQSNTPQHVGGLGIYDPSTAEGGFVRFKQVIANFEQRLQAMPLFRTRLVEVPGGIDRPYWVKDANFDVEFHLRHIALPEPGDWRQLCIQVARLHARQLDMSRPLWEAYIIEGLDNIPNLPEGSFAVYTKMHHSMVDGAGGASFMAALHDLEPNPPQPEAVENEPLLIDREPSTAELLGKASINRVRNTVGLLRGTASLVGELGKFALEVARKEVSMPDVQSPKTRFNNPVGPHRVFDAVDFPLADFKKIKDNCGVKLNDVALAVVGGALQRYLVAKGETPELPLAASLPVNMRTRRGETGDNNQVGAIFASLHTDITNPIERLKAIHASTVEAKQFGESSPLVDALKLAGIFSPAVSKAAASLWSERHLSRHIPLNTSTVITNVPGPNFDLYCAGARLVQYHGLGVLTPGVGLFHTVFSQGERMNMSVLGDRDTIPDPEFYIACLRESYEELLQAATGDRAKPAPRPAAKTVPTKKPGASKPARKKAAAKKATPARKKTPAKKKVAVKKSAAAKKPAVKKPSTVKPAVKNAPAIKAINSRPKARRKGGSVGPKLRVVGS